MKKNLTNILLLVVIILLIIEGIFIIKNSKDIKELKNQKDETEWVDERLDYSQDNSLVGTWTYYSQTNIITLKINNKNEVEFKTYMVKNKYYTDTNEGKNIDLRKEDLDNSEYISLLRASRGKLNGTTIVFTEEYTKENNWQETNAKTETVYKTSDITIKISNSTNELTKQK